MLNRSMTILFLLFYFELELYALCIHVMEDVFEKVMAIVKRKTCNKRKPIGRKFRFHKMSALTPDPDLGLYINYIKQKDT